MHDIKSSKPQIPWICGVVGGLKSRTAVSMVLLFAIIPDHWTGRPPSPSPTSRSARSGYFCFSLLLRGAKRAAGLIEVLVSLERCPCRSHRFERPVHLVPTLNALPSKKTHERTETRRLSCRCSRKTNSGRLTAGRFWMLEDPDDDTCYIHSNTKDLSVRNEVQQVQKQQLPQLPKHLKYPTVDEPWEKSVCSRISKAQPSLKGALEPLSVSGRTAEMGWHVFRQHENHPAGTQNEQIQLRESTHTLVIDECHLYLTQIGVVVFTGQCR